MSGVKRIAIIGGGIAGISAAHFLQRNYEVWLFERETRLGGHAHTHEVESENGRKLFIDSGFIVFNERNYPNFVKFLNELEVPSQASNMSFSYHAPLRNLYYAGTNLNGIFAQRRNLFRREFWNFFSEIPRFYSAGTKLLRDGDSSLSLGEFLLAYDFKKEFVELYLLPMGAAIWSTPAAEMLEFPALSFLRFWKNHGLLDLLDRPKWRTVAGGSHEYIKKFESRFNGKILKGVKIDRVQRAPEKVSIHLDQNTFVFDRVIFAVHANQVLPLLADPTPEEKANFSVWDYCQNSTTLHWDRSVLPPKERAWASWNYREFSKDRLAVSYHMNRLQNLSSEREYCVSLNWPDSIADSKTIATMNYEHPAYSLKSLRSQDKIKELNGKNRTYFCGSYLGHGFHEDAIRSSVETAKLLGVNWG